MLFGTLLVLLAYAAFLFWFIRYRYLPRYYCSVSSAESSASPYRLARAVRRILSVIHGIVFFLIVAWPVIYAVTIVSQAHRPEWTADISAYTGFKLNLDMIDGSANTPGLGSQITGKSLLKLESTNPFAFHLFAIWTYVRALIALYIILQLRNLFVSLGNGTTFEKTNIIRLKKIAIAILSLQIATPLLQYFGWGAVVKGIALGTQAVQLYPAFELNPIGIFTGLALLVLAGVMREAANMKDEQRLTI